MKSTIFLKPMEFGLEALGESWRQGQTIKGSLILKNHGLESVTFPLLKVALAAGKFKKIKSRADLAWEEVSRTIVGNNISINPGSEEGYNFSFNLPEDCPITDKDGSLYLIFSDKEDNSWPLGFLELVIAPKIAITQFIEVFENFLRFKVAQQKFSKGMIELKMNPPASREYGHIDSLVLRIKELNKTMDLEYNFTISAFDTSTGGMMAQKKAVKVNKSISAKDYCISGDVPNPDFMKSFITSVIKESTPKIFT